MRDENPLAEPASSEAIYRDWGTKPPLVRPLMQGDVFTDVVLPDFDDDEQPPYVQVTMHPCSMDTVGGRPRKRIMVSPVRPSTKLGSSAWRKRLKAMPLPKLLGPDKGDFITDLTERVSVRSIHLELSHRVAALSDDGILYLQQRLIMCDTRVPVRLGELLESNRAVFVETEIQEGWLEIAIDGVPDGLLESRRKEATEDFQDWLDEEIVTTTANSAEADGDTKSTRRAALHVKTTHAGLRREAYREARSRYDRRPAS